MCSVKTRHFLAFFWYHLEDTQKNADQKSSKVMVTNFFAFFWISLHSRDKRLKKTYFAKTFFVFTFLDIFKNVHFRKVPRLYDELSLLFQVVDFTSKIQKEQMDLLYNTEYRKHRL